ncbi:MAG: cell division protein SepF [Coriobacteriales bacterium]|nr:cell division protein SepF [Coriobacteriales bacterium]
MSWWHNMKVRLGLADDDWDEEYYEDEEYYDPESGDDDEDWEPSASRRPAYESPYGTGVGVKRVDRTTETRSSRRAERERVESMRSRSEAALRSVPTGAASVTPVAPQVKMHIAEPKSYGEAQPIADKLKEGTPVIMNMTMTSPDLAKRLIDFASGLTYGLDGNLQKVSDKVFMLTPHNVEVSDAERRRLRDTGLFGE